MLLMSKVSVMFSQWSNCEFILKNETPKDLKYMPEL